MLPGRGSQGVVAQLADVVAGGAPLQLDGLVYDDSELENEQVVDLRAARSARAWP